METILVGTMVTATTTSATTISTAPAAVTLSSSILSSVLTASPQATVLPASAASTNPQTDQETRPTSILSMMLTTDLPPQTVVNHVRSEEPPSNPQPMEETPVAAEVVDIEDDDDMLYLENDPVTQLMDYLNFTVVSRKPSSTLESFVNAGDWVTKSRYLEDRKNFLEVIKIQKQDLIKTQAAKENESAKLRETEIKMHKVVRIVAELHNLYGQFVRNLVLLMKKSSQGSNQLGNEMITIGPFPSVGEVDKLLAMLASLSNQFQNDFENLSKTKKAMKEVNSYLTEKANTLMSSSGDNIGPTEASQESSTGEIEGSVVSNDDAYSDAPTIVIPEEEIAPVENATLSQNTSIESNTPLNNHGATANSLITDATTTIQIPEPVTVSSNMSSPAAVTLEHENSITAFMPVLGPTQTNGNTIFSLVEYTKDPNLINKKHGIDSGRFDSGRNEYFCLCGENFSSISLMKYHIRYFTANWKFKCTLCSRKYPGLNFLKLHMLRAHRIMYVGSNACKFCRKSFHTARELLSHIRTAHRRKSSTDNSTPQSANLGSLAEGEPSSTKSTSSVLVVNGTKCACGSELGTRESLMAHIRSEVEVHGQDFKCSMCENVTFDHPCNFKNHLRVCHGLEYQDYLERQYGCSNCDAMFGSFEDLETHIVNDHHMDQTVQNQDPLSLDDPFAGSINVQENTITFHNNSNMDCESATLTTTENESLIITLDN